ncbi:MAG: Asp-tRNA(Asn)/Glu-tRNA(Gln) amidotransferase subunit GatB, partial [Oscillospiraceae bacterium]|nr:Asp-tRNA(Asn)/Glu-tRNA(Gln) amidotransferase subunit GatB [Oscillospiraceae bacterium]
MTWEMVVGLETHVELLTKSKIFCSCTTRFGGDPNTHCCPICTGHPGSLPVLNRNVVELAATAGLALGCRVNNRSVMARKHYVYPDLPKAYQISQFDMPLCEGGFVGLSNGRSVRITRIHIEEDAGKLIHENGAILIDYNRGGVPLIEIVSEPDIRNQEEAVEYLEKLQAILRAVGVSDCRMQEGSLRCDVNISIRPTGSDILGIRTEIKNLNSFTSVAAAIDFEFKRLIRLADAGGNIVQETRGWNAGSGETVLRRDKENADDYRYFPEPDIGMVYISDDDTGRLRETLPELPDKKLERYVDMFGLPLQDAKLLSKYSKVSEYFEAACEGVKSPKTVASFMVTQMFSVITTEIEREKLAPKTTAKQLGTLVSMLESGKLNRNLAKRIFAQMLETGRDAQEFISGDDQADIGPESLAEMCRDAIELNRKTVADFHAGKDK